MNKESKIQQAIAEAIPQTNESFSHAITRDCQTGEVDLSIYNNLVSVSLHLSESEAIKIADGLKPIPPSVALDDGGVINWQEIRPSDGYQPDVPDDLTLIRDERRTLVIINGLNSLSPGHYGEVYSFVGRITLKRVRIDHLFLARGVELLTDRSVKIGRVTLLPGGSTFRFLIPPELTKYAQPDYRIWHFSKMPNVAICGRSGGNTTGNPAFVTCLGCNEMIASGFPTTQI